MSHQGWRGGGGGGRENSWEVISDEDDSAEEEEEEEEEDEVGVRRYAGEQKKNWKWKQKWRVYYCLMSIDLCKKAHFVAADTSERRILPLLECNTLCSEEEEEEKEFLDFKLARRERERERVQEQTHRAPELFWKKENVWTALQSSSSSSSLLTVPVQQYILEGRKLWSWGSRGSWSSSRQHTN